VFGAPFPGSPIASLFFAGSIQEALSGSVSGVAADPTRIIVVAEASSGAVPTSVTCNGTAMNLRVNNGTRSRLWTLAVPTGTTISIVFTGGGAAAHAFGIYALYNVPSEVPFASINTGSTGGNLNVPAGGVAIGVQACSNPAGGTWTGLTRDWRDTAVSESQSGASGSFLTAQTPLVITITTAATASCAIASWSP
jgi:hypothetical protein